MGLLTHVVDDNREFIKSSHVVIWSGGCDSTLLLKEVAEAYGTPDKPIMALTVDHYLLDTGKRDKEVEARKNILTELKGRGLHILTRTIQIDGNVGIYQPNCQNPLQAYLWLSAIVPYLDNDSTVYFGYIRSDDATMKLEQIKKLFNDLTGYLGIDVTMDTPYIYYHKRQILAELMKADLYELAWYCECPQGDKPCGFCSPCETHSAALIEMAVRGNERAIPLIPKHVKIIKKHLPSNQNGRKLNVK